MAPELEELDRLPPYNREAERCARVAYRLHEDAGRPRRGPRHEPEARRVTTMARLKPSIRESETYTEPNFVRVYTAAHGEASGERLATVEHLSYRPKGDGQKPGWNCATIVVRAGCGHRFPDFRRGCRLPG